MGRILSDLRKDLLLRKSREPLVGRIAKRTRKVAARKTHKNSWRTNMVALALQRIKYFVDFHKLSN
jgi:hypothetical protein